jgi:hypothetical protein
MGKLHEDKLTRKIQDLDMTLIGSMVDSRPGVQEVLSKSHILNLASNTPPPPVDAYRELLWRPVLMNNDKIMF